MKQFMLFFLLTILSAFMASVPAAANRTFLNSISLEELVRQSQVIVIAQRANPFYTTEEITFQDKKCPTFTKITYNFNALKVLYNSTETSPEGKSINVLGANYDLNIWLHEAYYTKGISKSPIVDYYRTTAHIESDKYLILFLKYRDDKVYEFAAESSYAPWSQKQQVVNLIKKIKLKSPSN